MGTESFNQYTSPVQANSIRLSSISVTTSVEILLLYPVLDAVRICQGVSIRLSTTLPFLYDRQVPFCDRHHISCFGGFIRFHFLDVCSINMPVSRLRFSTLFFGSHQLHGSK